MNERIFPILTEYDKLLPFYLLGLGYDWEQEHVICPSGYFYQWIQCTKGEGELLVEGKSYLVKEGNAMLLLKGVSHEYYSVSSSWITNWMVFDGQGAEYFFHQVMDLTASKAFFLKDPAIFLSKFEAIRKIEQSDAAQKNVKCSAIIYDLLMCILQYTSVNLGNSASIKHVRLKPLFSYIDQNYNKTLTLEALAAIVRVTPQYLCSLFKQTTHTTPFEYINSVRIRKSKELLLLEPQRQIRDIAHSVGFEDDDYFRTVFKRLEHISPGQFRKIHFL